MKRKEDDGNNGNQAATEQCSIGKGIPSIRDKEVGGPNEMDSKNFDVLSRLLASGTSRRGALTLFASAFGLVKLEEVEAGGRRRSRKQKVVKKKGKGTPPCRGEGHPCVGQGNVCCPGLECEKHPGPGAVNRCVKKEPPKECKGKCSEKDPCPRLKDCECVFKDAGATTEEREGVCETKKPEPTCGGPCNDKKLCHGDNCICVGADPTKYVDGTCETKCDPSKCDCGCDETTNRCKPEVKCSDECHCGCDKCTDKCLECICPDKECDPKDTYTNPCGEHCECVAVVTTTTECVDPSTYQPIPCPPKGACLPRKDV